MMYKTAVQKALTDKQNDVLVTLIEELYNRDQLK